MSQLTSQFAQLLHGRVATSCTSSCT